MPPPIIPTDTLRAECPACHTSYALARLGLLTIAVGSVTTIVCVVCHGAFDCRVQEDLVDVTTPAPWWRVWDQTPTTTAVRTVYSTHTTTRP
jgi:hypothetical protein